MLQAQRPAVRKAAEERAKTAAANEALKAEKQALKLSSDEAWALESALLTEREALHADRVAQSAIFDEYKAEADLLDKEVNALLDERKKNKKALVSHLRFRCCGECRAFLTSPLLALLGDRHHLLKMLILEIIL